MKKLIYNVVARFSLQVNEERLIHISSFMYFAFIFSEYITITSSEALKMCEHFFFQEIKLKLVLLVIYLFNYDSSKSNISK